METTVKVLCYRSKTLANGEHPLMVCVCKDRKRKYQSGKPKRGSRKVSILIRNRPIHSSRQRNSLRFPFSLLHLHQRPTAIPRKGRARQRPAHPVLPPPHSSHNRAAVPTATAETMTSLFRVLTFSSRDSHSIPTRRNSAAVCK